MLFKEILTNLDKLTLNERVSILILLTSDIEVNTISEMARRENKTPRGIRISNQYKKIQIGKQTFAIKGMAEDNFPF